MEDHHCGGRFRIPKRALFRACVYLVAVLGCALQFDYISNPISQNVNAQVAPLTQSALGVNIKEPNSGYAAFYSGVLGSTLYAEAHASKKHFEFVGLGGHLTKVAPKNV